MTKLEQTKNSSWNFNTDPVNEWAYWDNDYDQIVWYSTDRTLPTLAEIEEKIVELEASEPMRVLRGIRDWYLKESDWTQALLF
jgi:hypothetical protein